jgi:hypothetical protein
LLAMMNNKNSVGIAQDAGIIFQEESQQGSQNSFSDSEFESPMKRSKFNGIFGDNDRESLEESQLPLNVSPLENFEENSNSSHNQEARLLEISFLDQETATLHFEEDSNFTIKSDDWVSSHNETTAMPAGPQEQGK